VQEALGVVIFLVMAVAIIVAVASLAHRDDLYDQIGRGGLSVRDSDAPRTPVVSSPATRAEQEEEIRQLLEAQNARRARRGQAALDVEAELGRLTAPPPAADAGLRAEVRELVLARNARRLRQGKEPLDVEAEVERQLRGV
jgi:hypothetical protein